MLIAAKLVIALVLLSQHPVDGAAPQDSPPLSPLRPGPFVDPHNAIELERAPKNETLVPVQVKSPKRRKSRRKERSPEKLVFNSMGISSPRLSSGQGGFGPAIANFIERTTSQSPRKGQSPKEPASPEKQRRSRHNNKTRVKEQDEESTESSQTNTSPSSNASPRDDPEVVQIIAEDDSAHSASISSDDQPSHLPEGIPIATTIPQQSDSQRTSSILSLENVPLNSPTAASSGVQDIEHHGFSLEASEPEIITNSNVLDLSPPLTVTASTNSQAGEDEDADYEVQHEHSQESPVEHSDEADHEAQDQAPDHQDALNPPVPGSDAHVEQQDQAQPGGSPVDVAAAGGEAVPDDAQSHDSADAAVEAPSTIPDDSSPSETVNSTSPGSVGSVDAHADYEALPEPTDIEGENAVAGKDESQPQSPELSSDHSPQETDVDALPPASTTIKGSPKSAAKKSPGKWVVKKSPSSPPQEKPAVHKVYRKKNQEKPVVEDTEGSKDSDSHHNGKPKKMNNSVKKRRTKKYVPVQKPKSSPTSPLLSVSDVPQEPVLSPAQHPEPAETQQVSINQPQDPNISLSISPSSSTSSTSSSSSENVSEEEVEGENVASQFDISISHDSNVVEPVSPPNADIADEESDAEANEPAPEQASHTEGAATDVPLPPLEDIPQHPQPAAAPGAASVHSPPDDFASINSGSNPATTSIFDSPTGNLIILKLDGETPPDYQPLDTNTDLDAPPSDPTPDPSSLPDGLVPDEDENPFMVDTTGSLLIIRKIADMSDDLQIHFNQLLQTAQREALLCQGEASTGALGKDATPAQQQHAAVETDTTSTTHQKQHEKRLDELAGVLFLKFQHILQDSKKVDSEQLEEFFAKKNDEIIQVVHEVLHVQPPQPTPKTPSKTPPKEGTVTRMSKGDLFKGKVLNNRKRLLNGSPKTSNDKDNVCTLIITTPTSKSYSRLYEFPVEEVITQLDSLSNDEFVALVQGTDASFLNQRLHFKVLDQSKRVAKEFDLDVRVLPPANRRTPPGSHYGATATDDDSYASVDRKDYASRAFRDERRRRGGRKRQKLRHRRSSSPYNRYGSVSVDGWRRELEDKHDDDRYQQHFAVNDGRASTTATVYSWQTPEDSARICEFYAYALQSVHDGDRKYHLRSIPPSCTNDTGVTKCLQADDIHHLAPEFFTTISTSTFSGLPGKKSISPEQMAQLPRECLQSLTIADVEEMPGDVFEKMSPDKLTILAPDVRACKIKTAPQPASQEASPKEEQSTTRFALPVSLGVLGTVVGYACFAAFV